jgi:hypothetical protein
VQTPRLNSVRLGLAGMTVGLLGQLGRRGVLATLVVGDSLFMAVGRGAMVPRRLLVVVDAGMRGMRVLGHEMAPSRCLGEGDGMQKCIKAQ